MANGFSFSPLPTQRSVPPQQVGSALAQGASPAHMATPAAHATMPMADLSKPPVGMSGAPMFSDGQYPRHVPGSQKMGGMTDEMKPTTGSQMMVDDAKRAMSSRWRADLNQPGAPSNDYVLQSKGFTPAEIHLMKATGQVRV